MPIRVVNIWKHHRSPDEVRVYVGRACRGYPASPLGNPYRTSEGGRDAALAQYRVWLRNALSGRLEPQTGEILRLARLVVEGRDVVLLCWCSPQPCHGDIVAEAVERLAERMRRSRTSP